VAEAFDLASVALEKQLGHVMELHKLLKGMRNGPSPQRKKAMAVLFLERGIKCSLVRSFLHLSRRSARNYWERYRYGSTIALFAKRMNARRKCQDDRIKQAVFSVLHSPPSVHGINRTTWKMSDLQRILREQGHSISRDLISTIIKGAGFKWRKARIVLTSVDPDYQTKVEKIVKILSELKSDEAFFSIDEFGPFAVKRMRRPEARRSRGRLRGSPAPKVQRQSDYYSCFGTFPQPGDPLLLGQEEHPGNDQDDGSTACPISQLLDYLPLMGCSLMAHFPRSSNACQPEK